MCYVTSLATALSIPIIICFNHAKCFNLSKHRLRCSTRHICDYTASCAFYQYDSVTQNRGSTDRLSTCNYLTWLSLLEKTINVLCHSPSAIVSSVERIEPVHSKARERWGPLKTWKRIPGSTKHSGNWVTTSNVKPRVMKQLEQFAYISGVRTHQ